MDPFHQDCAFVWMFTYLSRGLLTFVLDDTRTHLHPQWVVWETKTIQKPEHATAQESR
jgi:hypothetical protein